MDEERPKHRGRRVVTSSKRAAKRALSLVGLRTPDALSVLGSTPADHLRDVMRELERLSERAAWLAGYIEQRACGEDRSHECALIMANGMARVVWCKAFGHGDHLARKPAGPKAWE